MIIKAIRPWGQAPTPLIPKSIIEEFGDLEAPKTIKKILGTNTKIADLDENIWNYVDSVSGECLTEIVYILNLRYNNFKHLHIYSNKKLFQPLESLPFSTRTKNVVMRYPDKFLDPQLKFDDIISISSMGVRSAIEFACVIESAINLTLVAMGVSQNNQPENRGLVEFFKINSVFQVIAAWAFGEQKQNSFANALPEPLPEWPDEIKKTWIKLSNIKTKQLAGEAVKQYSVPELVMQGLGNMDQRLLHIAKERIFAVDQVTTLEELGHKLEITRERVRQLEKKAVSEFERFKTNKYLPVLRRSQSLANKLGTTVPVGHSTLEDALNWVVEDFSEKRLAKLLLLWLAGPYRICQNQDWILSDKELEEKTITAFLECRDKRGTIREDVAHDIMSGLGINAEYHLAWVEHLQIFLKVEEDYIHFQGGILDKAHTLLQYFVRPMIVEEMLEYIGGNSVRSVRSARQRLIDDNRFWRVNKQNEFVLAGTEGYDEYTGIIDEIIQQLELCGGQAPISHLVEKLSSIYGVKKSSIIAYLNTPRFTKDENGIIRIRDVEDGINIKTDITKAAACYFSDEGIWCWRKKIDKDTVRGSGCLIPNAFAQHLGCDIGNKIKVSTEFGLITLSWQLTSTTGAYIGSLRQVINCHGADLGDYLFIKATKPDVTFILLEQEQVESAHSNLVKLALLLGRVECQTEDEAVFEIATALGINQTTDEVTLTEARRKLMSKGETDLVQLIQ